MTSRFEAKQARERLDSLGRFIYELERALQPHISGFMLIGPIVLFDSETVDAGLEVRVHTHEIADIREDFTEIAPSYRTSYRKIVSTEVSKGVIDSRDIPNRQPSEPMLRVALGHVYLPNEQGAMTEIQPGTQSWDEAEIILSTVVSRLDERQAARLN